jgi:hypothetical protein
VSAGGSIGSNGCSSPTAVSVNGTVDVYGNVAIGAGCAVSSGYSQSGSPTVTGTKPPQTTNRVLTSVTVPTVGTNQGNRSVSSHGTLNLATNQTYGAVNASGGSHVVLNAGCEGLQAQLEEIGYTVHPVDLSEYLKSGGAAKCLTLRLD